MIAQFFGGPLEGQSRALEEAPAVITCEVCIRRAHPDDPEAPLTVRQHRYILDRGGEYGYRLPSDTTRHYVWGPLWATRERQGRGGTDE